MPYRPLVDDPLNTKIDRECLNKLKCKAVLTSWGLAGAKKLRIFFCIYKMSKPFTICHCYIAKIQLCVSVNLGFPISIEL